MPDISISLTITDELHKVGVAYARNLRNSTLPAKVQDKSEDGSPKVDEEGNAVMVPNPEIISDDAAYVTWVGLQAVKSYARQKILADFQDGLINKDQRDALLANPAVA